MHAYMHICTYTYTHRLYLLIVILLLESTSNDLPKALELVEGGTEIHPLPHHTNPQITDFIALDCVPLPTPQQEAFEAVPSSPFYPRLSSR